MSDQIQGKTHQKLVKAAYEMKKMTAVHTEEF